ncbi:MAG: ThuA domain-containing protein [Chloroflexi bacterium]|nr:ThuA domain-containing protein [Chloroflexota bacterium]
MQKMVTRPKPIRAHVITGGYPPGSPAGHDHDFARLRVLELLYDHEGVHTTVAGDYTDLEKWLEPCTLLVSYVAGPVAHDEQNKVLRQWIEAGGRWLALHGSSGGRAVRVQPEGRRRRMVKMPYHETLGGFFINHPPIRKFRVDTVDPKHPLTRGMPESFETIDEPYMVELQQPPRSQVLLTSSWGPDPTGGETGFVYDEDTSLFPDGKTRAVAYVREMSQGAVAYTTLGHAHTPTTNSQVRVDDSVVPGGEVPLTLRGSWETAGFRQLLKNGIAWGLGND